MHVDRAQAQDDTTDKDKIVREARERLEQSVNAWGNNHDLAENDIDMRAGEQWDADVKRQREEDKRPTLTFNRLETYIQQVVGEQRRNRPGIHVAPADMDVEEEIPGTQQRGDGQPLTHNKSDVLEGMIRQIEYKSRANVARDTAFDHAVGNGFGFYRLVTDYANESSFEQEIRVKRIRNPFAVYLDPAIETTTGEDATYAFISDWMQEDEFKQLYPDSLPKESLPTSDSEGNVFWWADQQVRVVEYFRRVPEEKTIALLNTGETVNLGTGKDVEENKRRVSEFGARIVRERKVKQSRVEWYLLNGNTILEGPKTFPSRYIPIIPVWGREIINDGETIYQSLIRHSLDAQKNYNYWRSAMTEMVALAPKAPFVGPAKAFQGYQHMWETANLKNWSYLPYSDDAPAPPQRQPGGDIPQGATQEAQSADYDMKATIGMHEASLGEPSNERSGKAIQARRQEGETGAYIFIDNLNRAIEHEGRVILDMIPRVYDTERTVRIRQADGEGDFVKINQDTPEGRMADVTQGEWDVVVKSGPSYQTQREEFVNSLFEASRAYPDLWKVAGDLLVQNMDWPGSEKIAERLKKTMPAQIMADEPGDTPQAEPTPEQQIQQMELEVRKKEAEAKLAKAQGEVEREGMKTEQEIEDTKQSMYEMRTEVYQMLTNLKEAQENLAQRDIDSEVQNAVSDAIQELASRGLLAGMENPQESQQQ